MNPTERCICGYSRVDDIKHTCAKCGNQLDNPSRRCSCGYSTVDNSDYRCAKCNNRLKSQFERCICGYSRNDDTKRYCKRSGAKITNSNSTCPQCCIVSAGYNNWEIYNPTYKLILNNQCIFEGYKHLCTEFMENQLICSKGTAKNWLKGDRVVFNPKQRSKKYPNNFKYAGLVAELIPYPDDKDDSNKES